MTCHSRYLLPCTLHVSICGIFPVPRPHPKRTLPTPHHGRMRQKPLILSARLTICRRQALDALSAEASAQAGLPATRPCPAMAARISALRGYGHAVNSAPTANKSASRGEWCSSIVRMDKKACRFRAGAPAVGLLPRQVHQRASASAPNGHAATEYTLPRRPYIVSPASK